MKKRKENQKQFQCTSTTMRKDFNSITDNRESTTTSTTKNTIIHTVTIQ